MWISDPHRCMPRLGFFVSSSEEPLHHPEIPFSSSVRPESLLNSLWWTYWSLINETTSPWWRVFVSCHFIIGSSIVEQWLSFAQYGIRAEICPSSWHDYHSIYIANDDQGCGVRPWRNLRIILSSDIHHEECSFLMRYSRSSE